MSWIHSSRGAILGVLLAISLMAVGTATAISVSGETPAPENVNDTTSMNVTVEDPFEGQLDQWTLQGTTELESATWEVKVYEQGQLVDQTGGQGSVNVTLNRSGQTTPDRINISVSGDVPDDIEYDYEDRSTENYTVVTLTNTDTGDELQSWDAHRYTAQSQNARQKIDNVSGTIDEINNPSEDVQNRLNQSISAYNQGNFDNAVSIAEDAQSMANEEKQAQQSNNGSDDSDDGLPLPLIAGGVVVLLLVAGGGIYYWQSQQGEDYKLQ